MQSNQLSKSFHMTTQLTNLVSPNYEQHLHSYKITSSKTKKPIHYNSNLIINHHYIRLLAT